MGSRDVAVQLTNDDATACKACAVGLGYWKDDFIQAFARGRVERKTPEINRGYYARVKGVWSLVTDFIQKCNNKCQIISIGCGFDTLFWRLQQESYKVFSYVEMDFHPVVQKKMEIIKRNEKLQEALHTPDGEIYTDGKSLHSEVFHLLGVDLRQTGEVLKELDSCKISKSLPTLIIAECVLVYMKPSESQSLLGLLAGMFETCVFINYEQVNMGDRFGQVMLDNLEARGCSLAGVDLSKSKETQRNRFKVSGWDDACVKTMDEVYKSFPSPELRRIEKIEFFDELELLDQLLYHYCIAVAWKNLSKYGIGSLGSFELPD